ncbi:catalase-like [Pararge aegeria]|uniref:catalase-like n=1 Tax=Pararge aegeria TaxID=116150 RepID=UPI0019D045F8|nr:catalase-like [Pararge aegeria]
MILKMLAFLVMLAASAAATNQDWHPAVDSVLLSQIRENSPADLMSVSNGAPVTYCEVNSTLNKPLIRNAFLMDHVTSMDRERTSGRTLHNQGSGAFGYFEVTHDISHICKAKLFDEIGKKTPVAIRFSPAANEKGAPELNRGARGFSVKFYTEEGNLDLPGLNMPMFFSKNPLKFREFVYALRKDPAVYFYNPMGLWDIIISNPEALNMFLLVFGDRGIPKTYRHMPGYNIHTLQVVNEKGENHFVRLHFTPDAGIKHLTSAEAQKVAATDPDFYTRDLYDAIEKGDYPSWTVSIQIASEADVQSHGWCLFDITRVLPINEFPKYPFAKIVLNRNPKNYFAEIEQLAFCPANLVNGILGAPDKVYEARRFAYADAQLYRLGPNFEKIPVNCPLHVTEYSDSYDEPVGSQATQNAGLLKIKEEEPYNLDQAAELYENEMTADERARLHKTVIAMLTPASSSVQQKVIELFTSVHPDLGNTIAQGLNAR